MLSALANRMPGLSESALRARLSVAGGDGQVVAGGPEHRHKPSKAAELIWCRLHPGASADDASDIICCVMWDSFHRVDIGGMRAVMQVRMAQEVYDIAAALDSQFGVGEGRNLLMGVAAQLDETSRKVLVSRGNPQSGVLLKHSNEYLISYKSYVAALRGRLAWKQSGHGTQTLTSLLGMGRRLQDVPFVVFLLCFRDILERIVRPF